MISLDPEVVEAARAGSRAALAQVVEALEPTIHNLAVRMLGGQADADDATQEILVQVITHLGTLRDAGAAAGWALAVACRHLQHRRKAGVERLELSFEDFAADLERGQQPLESLGLSAAEGQLLAGEVKQACTLAMLTCLSREQRMAYVLGDIFELTDAEAALVLEVSAPTFRQRLHRARGAVQEFLARTCGVVSESNECRCERRVAPALRLGRLRQRSGTEQAAGVDVAQLRSQVQRLESGQRAAALFRSNPDFLSRVGALVLASLTEA